MIDALRLLRGLEERYRPLPPARHTITLHPTHEGWLVVNIFIGALVHPVHLDPTDLRSTPDELLEMISRLLVSG